MKRFACGILTLAGVTSFSLSRPAGAVSEAQFFPGMEEAEKYFFSQARFGTFTGTGEVKLSYVALENPQEIGALVVVNGRTETYAKYVEFFYDLRNTGLSIYAYDHRGQGFSQRLLSDPMKGHVDDFTAYVEDLGIFVQAVVRRTHHARISVLSHSLGGAIAALYLERHPGTFARAIFSAPMFGIRTAPLPRGVTHGLASFLTLIGLGDEYAPGSGPYDPSAERNRYTHSEARYAASLRVLRRYPQTVLGGPTSRWVKEALEGSEEAVAGAGRIEIPLLLLQAGQDELVEAEAQNDFVAGALNCRKIAYPEARHELLIEKDAIRNGILRRIGEFVLR